MMGPLPRRPSAQGSLGSLEAFCMLAWLPSMVTSLPGGKGKILLCALPPVLLHEAGDWLHSSFGMALYI